MTIAGKKLDFGGKTFVVAPLNIKSLKVIGPLLQDYREFAASGEFPSAEKLDSIVQIVHLSLSRNNPDTTVEFVEDNIDLGNIHTVITTIMLAAKGDAPEAGEGKAASL